MRFSLRYFIAFLIIFTIELLIGLYVRDQLIRPFVGDLLVVILIYTFLMSFLKVSPAKMGLGVFLFAVMVETLQYFNLVQRLHLQGNKVASIIMGTTFDLRDMDNLDSRI